MIQFPCTCHHVFNVTDDQVGDDIQCPNCGRLNTVPTAGDVGMLDNDGTYRVDGPVEREQSDPAREAELMRVYSKSRKDAYGNDIDLRSHASALDYQRVGIEAIELLPEGKEKPASPKYDPETGELIRPMEVEAPIVRTPERRAQLPVRPLKRRQSVQRLTRVQPLSIWAAMFKPTNLIVLSIVFGMHLLYLTSIMISGYLLFVGVGSLFLALGIVAHFGNVIDETGPASRDELPRPLRNLSWHDDLWGPFWGFVLTWAVCYGPSYLILHTAISNDFVKLALAGLFSLLGTAIAPAVLLITQTSGSFVNLMPGRIFSTIRGCGAMYPLLVLLFVVSVPVYFAGFVGMTFCCVQWVMWTLADITKAITIKPPPATAWLICGALLFAGIWLLNFFGWVLGQTYRVYHRNFLWAYQGSLDEDEDAPPTGFAVLPSTRVEPVIPTGPLQAIPLQQIPMSNTPIDYSK